MSNDVNIEQIWRDKCHNGFRIQLKEYENAIKQR